MSSHGKSPAAKPRTPDVVMRDRFYYVVSQCVARKTVVTVTTGSGDMYTGKLHVLVKDGAVLHHCKKSGSEEMLEVQKFNEFQTLEFEIGEDRTQPVKFKRDGEITRAKAPGRRELQKYAPETPVQHTLDDPSILGKFDQFETNRKLFGVTATFNEDQYTTPLVRPDELTPAQIKRTEKVIKALTHAQALDDAGGEAEEEERFAAVKGTGRFKEESEEKPASYPVLTNSSGDLPSFRFEKPSLATEKPQNPPTIKNYRQIRVDLVRGKKIHPGLVSDPEGIEALQLEVATFRNDVVVDGLIRFKEERERAKVKKAVEELKEFKGTFIIKPKVDDSKAKKDERKEELGEIAEEIPASLMDVFLESLAEQDTPFEPVDPYWPVPPDHRALTVPPTHNTPELPPPPPNPSLSLNPDAPAFEFSLLLA